MNILLDMDDVLVDFANAAREIHGLTLEEYDLINRSWHKGTWPETPPQGLTIDAFWEPIHAAGAPFWLRLKPFIWTWELVTTVACRNPDWKIVTAPSKHPSSREGKRQWLYNFIGRPRHYRFTSHKHLLATPNTVLIDDREKNIEDFRKAGGIGILFPGPCNAASEYLSDPVSYVVRELDLIRSETCI